MGYSKSSSKKEDYSNTILPQGTRKTSSKQSNFTTKKMGQEEQQQKKTKLAEGKRS